MNTRMEIYEELIALGYTPEDAWSYISEIDFAEDEEEEE